MPEFVKRIHIGPVSKILCCFACKHGFENNEHYYSHGITYYVCDRPSCRDELQQMFKSVDLV